MENYKIISAKSVRELNSKIKNVKEKIFLKSTNYKLNRYAVEKRKVDGLIGVETDKRLDKTHYRRSGLDSIICKFMAENGVDYVIDFRLFAKSKEKAIIFGRMKQNVRLCLKYKTPIKIISGNRDKEVLIAFGEVLGMNKKEAKSFV
jgi:RNase P/RNase MRP subunit p30